MWAAAQPSELHDNRVMLNFAYGSNMSREPMRQRCPGAQMIGTATLRRHRFIIMANGYASVVPASSSEVHGILWRLPRAIWSHSMPMRMSLEGFIVA